MVKLVQLLTASAFGAAVAKAAADATTTETFTKTKTVTSITFETRTRVKTVTEVDYTVVTKTETNTKKVPADTTTVFVTVTAPAVTSPTTRTVTLTGASCSSTGSSLSSSTGSVSSSSSRPVTSSSSTSSSSSSINTNPTTTATAMQANPTMGLNDYAKAIGKYLGTAVDIPGTGEGSDPIYLAVANNIHEFGSRTPANTMKWMYVEPQRGVNNFTGGDIFVNQTKAIGINHIRCHALLWHQQLPSWLTSQTWDNATLISIIKTHIASTVAHFGDNCYSWDVVNEAIDDSANLRTSIFSTTIGPEFIPIAFQAASDAIKANNLKTKLYYNDYNIEGPNTAKTNATIALIKSLQARGIQIDGVGLQSHFIIGNSWGQSSLTQAMTTYAALGVEIAITELDVRATTLPVSYDNQIVQFNTYRGTVAACAATAKCVGVTLWDFDDTYSWIPYTFAGQGYGCPWFLPVNGTALVKKIAYDGIIDGFKGTTDLRL